MCELEPMSRVWGVAAAVEGAGWEPGSGADSLGLRIQSPTSGWERAKPPDFSLPISRV